VTQYHFLDESGDPGFNESESSSRHFVLAMVQMPIRESLPELDSVRDTLHLPKRFEFKYHKTKPRQKAIFFNAIQPLAFRVRAVVIDKTTVKSKFAGSKGQNFVVEFLAQLVLRAPTLDLASDILIIDGATPSYPRALRIKLSHECRKTKRVRPFKQIIGADSDREDGLQLADMIAGALRRHSAGIETEFYKTFKNKVVDLWEVK
jgi:hypothetical protein